MAIEDFIEFNPRHDSLMKFWNKWHDENKRLRSQLTKLESARKKEPDPTEQLSLDEQIRQKQKEIEHWQYVVTARSGEALKIKQELLDKHELSDLLRPSAPPAPPAPMISS